MSLLHHSILKDALLPDLPSDMLDEDEDFRLRRWIRHSVAPTAKLKDLPIVVFDTETTGLDFRLDRIIEFGAMKYLNGKKLDEFWSFTKTDIELTENIQNLTGITQDMIKDAPAIEEVIPRFLDFIKGSVIVAHNAEFDMSMLKAACSRMGLDLAWPAFCTVKLTRRVLPGLQNYKLDTLAEHFGLAFEARHRAVGDVKVLAGVLDEILDDEELGVVQWQDLKDAILES